MLRLSEQSPGAALACLEQADGEDLVAGTRPSHLNRDLEIIIAYDDQIRYRVSG